MKNKKVNPKNRPASQKDVEKARKIAQSNALITCEAIFLTVMMDKFGMEDRLNDVWNEVNKLSDEIKERRVSLTDLITVLYEEYGIRLQDSGNNGKIQS